MNFGDTHDGRIRRFEIGKDFSSLPEIDPLALPNAAPGSADGATVIREGPVDYERGLQNCPDIQLL